jgi:hypothetical protein
MADGSASRHCLWVATLCVEAQERRELAERQFRAREDQYR